MSIRAVLFFIVLAVVLLTSVVRAQEPPALTSNPAPQTETTAAASKGEGTEQPRAFITYKTPYEFFLCLLTLALAVFMASILCAISWRSGLTEEFIRSFIVLVVVFAALFLIVAGYSEKQTAPVFGLLGTVVGYVFGRMSLAPAVTIETANGRPGGPVETTEATERPAGGGSAFAGTNRPL
jgi:hypothetical protein